MSITADGGAEANSSEAALPRCEWALGFPLMTEYHDREWGVPMHDDRLLFELLTLEGAQAGLSWATILNKREGYHDAFAGFDPAIVARLGLGDFDRLVQSPLIVRNRSKIESAVGNARAVLSLIDAFGTFDQYIWGFVGRTPIQNAWKSSGEIPAQTLESQTMSKDLKKRGFRFVGPTICYAFMQSAGMVNDHLVSCHRHRELSRPS
jgi:DNA-3-methyladenine glycosylase I